jgi:hypothetical protein
MGRHHSEAKPDFNKLAAETTARRISQPKMAPNQHD